MAVGTHTCTRLLFRTDTNDLAGGARRGKGAMVTSHTCFVLREGPAGWGGLPTTATELPTPSQLQRPAARPCVRRDWATGARSLSHHHLALAVVRRLQGHRRLSSRPRAPALSRTELRRAPTRCAVRRPLALLLGWRVVVVGAKQECPGIQKVSPQGRKISQGSHCAAPHSQGGRRYSVPESSTHATNYKVHIRLNLHMFTRRRCCSATMLQRQII